MSLKKIKIIGIIGTFLLCFLFHFLYEWLPNSLFSIFFPVNESIWEHMKIIYSSFVFYGIIDYILLKKYENINNFLFSLFIIPVIGIAIYLIIYMPVYNMIGENMIFSILLLFIVIVIEHMMSYYLLQYKPIKYQSIIGIIGIVIVYIAFGYLTYNPLINYVFFDIVESKYGINIYVQ